MYNIHIYSSDPGPIKSKTEIQYDTYRLSTLSRCSGSPGSKKSGSPASWHFYFHFHWKTDNLELSQWVWGGAGPRVAKTLCRLDKIRCCPRWKNSWLKATESMSFQVHWEWLSKSANTSRTLGDALAWVQEGDNFKGCLSPIDVLEIQGNPHDGEGAVSLEHHQLSAGDWVSMADCFKTWQVWEKHWLCV